MCKRKGFACTNGLILLSLLLCSPLTARAYSAEDLYNDCNVKYTSPYNSEDLETINNYNYAKRYVSMFRYVSSSEYDEGIINNRIDEYEKQLSRISDQLQNSYGKSEDDIFQLEADYYDTLRKLKEAQQSLNYQQLEVSGLSTDEIPTYAEYVNALNRKKVAELNCNLGDIARPTLSTNALFVKEYDSTSVTYTAISGGIVTSMYNGVVVGVGSDHVTINHHNDIVSSYKGIVPKINIGDTVIQGNPIGVTSGEFSVKLRVSGVFIDVHELLEVSDDIQD